MDINGFKSKINGLISKLEFLVTKPVLKSFICEDYVECGKQIF